LRRGEITSAGKVESRVQAVQRKISNIDLAPVLFYLQPAPGDSCPSMILPLSSARMASMLSSPSAKASSCGMETGAWIAKNATQYNFLNHEPIADRVFGQLNDPRMGQLAGKLDADALQKLANNSSATRFMDARTGHINVIQVVEGKLIRMTVPRDGGVVSVGPITPNQIKNFLGKGDFVPLP